MSSDLLVELLQTLDAPQGRYAELDRYVDDWHGPAARPMLAMENHHVAGVEYRTYVSYGLLSIGRGRPQYSFRNPLTKRPGPSASEPTTNTGSAVDSGT